MAIYVKALFFVVLIAVVSAMPLDGENEPQDAQVDLLSVENVPDQDVASSDSNDDLTRNKRHYGIGIGLGGFGIPIGYGGYGGYGGGYGGYPYGGYGGGYGGYGGGYGGYGGGYGHHHHHHGGYGGGYGYYG